MGNCLGGGSPVGELSWWGVIQIGVVWVAGVVQWGVVLEPGPTWPYILLALISL